ncbi:MAG: hypothetical protein AB2L11_00945 [Syntrophobacteraceae bacterium]
MCKIITLIILIALALSSPAHSKSFTVRSIDNPPGQAVLFDNVTGEEWIAGEGDSKDGWTVREIGPAHIILLHAIDEHRVEMVTMPAEPEAAIPVR